MPNTFTNEDNALDSFNYVNDFLSEKSESEEDDDEETEDDDALEELDEDDEWLSFEQEW